MKKLIFTLIILPSFAFAIDEMNQAVTKKVMSVVQDAKVEDMLSGAAEFKACRDKNPILPTDNAQQRSIKLDAATNCFTLEVKKQGPEAIKKLSSTLQLENYGLVKTKSINDVTEYLAKKMTKSLTGVDPDEKEHSKIIEKLKWENQKIVDQKVFIDLHVNQLMKSALFEVSRFCLENFRAEGSTGTDFYSHWDSKWSAIETGAKPVITDITDTGDVKDSFLKLANGDLSDKSKTYTALTSSLSKSGTALNPDRLGKFFAYCQSSISILCSEFKKPNNAEISKAANNTVIEVAANSKMSKGATACLTMDKLKSIRTALANSQKVAGQFEEYQKTDRNAAIAMLSDPDYYKRGKGGNGEESLDSLTSYTSADMLGSENDELEKLHEKCDKDHTDAGCEDFLIKTDSLDNAINNVEITMNLKRELEIGNLEKIINNPDEVKKYLEENAHFELLQKIKDDPKLLSNGPELTKELKLAFDAKKVAEIQALRLKIGKRQMNEADYNAEQNKQTIISDNIKETKEERARLAQVVMFNNIITSQLELEDKATGEKVGRNVTAWNKEEAVLNQNKGSYNENLFSGLKDKKNGNKLEDASVVGGGIIDSILGKRD